MDLLRRLERRLGKARRVVVPQPRRVVDFDTGPAYAAALQQAEDVARNQGAPDNGRQYVEVMLQVSDDERQWYDLVVWWSGYYRPEEQGGIPTPSKRELASEVAATGYRYGRAVVRASV